MADDIVIRAESLGKKYVIGHEAQRERYVALRERHCPRRQERLAHGRRHGQGAHRRVRRRGRGILGAEGRQL